MQDPGRRFFVPLLSESEQNIALSRQASDHARVLRLKVGQEVELFDGQGHVATATIQRIAGSIYHCRLCGPITTLSSARPLVLLAALPKSETLQRVTRSATELGVSEIRWLTSERTLPHWSAEKVEAKLERLRGIAQDAARQSERASLPLIVAPEPLEQACARKPPDAWGVAWHARSDSVLPPAPPGAPAAWVVLGPEGGFSGAEVEALEKLEYSLASMGSTILRVETAVSAALALVADRLGGG